MDFYSINTRTVKEGVVDIYPDFKVGRSKDLMVLGKGFYAIWDEEAGLWSTDEYDVQRLVDKELEEYKRKYEKEHPKERINLKRMRNFSSRMWSNYRLFVANMADNSHRLDNNLTFANTKVKKTDYVSKRLPYSLEKGSIKAYNSLVKVLYDEEERLKFEWAIGAIISGDAKNIQKFAVFYGEGGSGKSTILNIIERLFEGYTASFEAKALTASNNSFSTEPFKSNPLVAIQHDGDLSRIEDNTKLNSIVSHEEMTMNEKYKPSYSAKTNCFLFIGTNKPVKITDAKSGIIRRLIDIKPTGNKINEVEYEQLCSQIQFELGAIAHHCLQLYKSMGKHYYDRYRPLNMIYQTDTFFNFVESSYDIFKEQDGVSLAQAYSIYKTYCDDALLDFKLPRHKFREELKSYFDKFHEYYRSDDKKIRSYYTGFNINKFKSENVKTEETKHLILDKTVSILDEILSECPAQYANNKETPKEKWENVKSKLRDINTQELHYVKPLKHHIVIDFDLKDNKGNKSLLLNLEEAYKWPYTYAELSKGGNGVHLHYIYKDDVSRLCGVYSEGIEVKAFTGNMALRRKLTKCNSASISIIKDLPLKKGKEMLNFEGVKSERYLRDMINRNVAKDIHPGTKPSIDFIYHILEKTYKSDLKYDVTDLRQKVLRFASKSSNQAEYCIKLVNKMKFKSEEPSINVVEYNSEEIIFFDVEVFPNLFVVCWKKQGGTTVKMINPSGKDLEFLFKLRLIGFNNRRYDNHIMYARYIGYDNLQLYNLSQNIIKNSKNVMFGEAYNISYADVYEFSSKKQSLKKFEIELKIPHKELGMKWDEEVPEDRWDEVADYCCNDVDALEEVFKDREQDFMARQLLADLSGLSVNDTTRMHATKIIFGDDKKPQSKFNYVDLSTDFPGYKFENGKSTYRGEETGEGGYVYAEPGVYTNVAVLDIASMHPASLIEMNMFGPYTERFKDIRDARLAIKHKDYESAKKMLNGALTKYLTSKEKSKELAYALKIIINSIYGFTSAKFDNPFKDPRNIDNIVAKRGALFMINLKKAVQEQGYIAAHIKTDSIKIPNATEDIIKYVMEFGKKYGYDFEHEETYSRFCLVNDAVYIAKKKSDGEWTATGAQFAHPYVFKTLFSGEPIEFDDLCETKSVSTALYLDIPYYENEHNYIFIGKVGRFCPVKPTCDGGGMLMREKEGKYYAANGSKGYWWMESETVKNIKLEHEIDMSYFDTLITKAKETLSEFCNVDIFIEHESVLDEGPPWEI